MGKEKAGKEVSATVTPQTRTSRFELKYWLTPFQYYEIRNALLPYMKPDFFTRKARRKKYLVRSLYFDTHDYSAHQEKMSGNCDRVKFRLRTYSAAIEDTARIRVELKVRLANTMEKHSAFVSLDEYQHFMRQWHWPKNEEPVLGEFERYVHLRAL